MRKPTNLEGILFGELTAVYIHSRSRNGAIRWHCICSCGKEKDVLASHLMAGNIKSCGCKIPNGKEHKQWTGYGEISGQFWGNIKRGADGSKGRKQLEFNITIDYAWDIFIKQNGKCALSGIDIYLPKRYNDTGNASLDRIDSSKGYIKENIQWIHKDINKMKNSYSQDYFINICRLVTKHCSL